MQRLHQEVGGSHPRFDCPERMLDRLAPLAHFFRVLVEPALHGFENMLMLPARDPSFLAGAQLCLMAHLALTREPLLPASAFVVKDCSGPAPYLPSRFVQVPREYHIGYTFWLPRVLPQDGLLANYNTRDLL
jgi:hypothetical protein